MLGALVGFFVLSGAMSALPALAQAPTLPPPPTYLVEMTGYNAVPEQTDSDPFTTASGLYSNPEIVAARSRDMAKELPFGTIIAIEGPETNTGSCGYSSVRKVIGYRIIADTMNARYTERIDILFDTHTTFNTHRGAQNASRVLGICNDIVIRVMGRLDISKPGKLPQTQAALRALVESGSALALNK